jgi:hypothetical protein
MLRPDLELKFSVNSCNGNINEKESLVLYDFRFLKDTFC